MDGTNRETTIMVLEIVDIQARTTDLETEIHLSEVIEATEITEIMELETQEVYAAHHLQLQTPKVQDQIQGLEILHHLQMLNQE